jgi:hypothetical protein
LVIREDYAPELELSKGLAVTMPFGGLNAAATALGFSGAQQLQNAIQTFCGG